jgi:hypothetical protein
MTADTPQRSLSRRTRIAILVVVIAVALFGWLGLTHNTPDGQAPLVDVTADAMSSLKTEFNRAAGGTRIIVLLAPT